MVYISTGFKNNTKTFFFYEKNNEHPFHRINGVSYPTGRCTK
jgi:hypothetical protein